MLAFVRPFALDSTELLTARTESYAAKQSAQLPSEPSLPCSQCRYSSLQWRAVEEDDSGTHALFEPAQSRYEDTCTGPAARYLFI